MCCTTPVQVQMCLLPELRDTLLRLLPPPNLEDSEALTEFKTSVSSARAILEDPNFLEMREFVTPRKAAWVPRPRVLCTRGPSQTGGLTLWWAQFTPVIYIAQCFEHTAATMAPGPCL